MFKKWQISACIVSKLVACASKNERWISLLLLKVINRTNYAYN